ncbi:MAG: oligosaccharide flippase family protein [Candidatus Cloacimonetes bacterium]|nr:oligosaccharide flippase family protein [Candidatus Cloacimonadota bacterium]
MKELKKSFWDFITANVMIVLAVPLMIISESIQARYLGPENYGKVALFLGAILILYSFGLSWLRLSIIRFGKEEFIKENHLRKTTADFFIISLFSFFVISILFYSFKKPILDFLEIEKVYLFWVIIFGAFISLIKLFILEVLKVIRLIKLYTFLFRLASKLFIAFGMLLFVLSIIGISVIYVIYIYLISDILVIIIAFSFVKPKYILPLRFDEVLIKKMIIFSLPLLFNSWSSYVITWVDTYVIKYYMTLEDVGIYQAAYKILNTFKSFFGMGLVAISTPIIMVFKTKGEIDKIKNFYIKRLIPQVSFFAMILVSLIIIFSNQMFHIIYGDEFNSSIIVFKILVASVSFTMIAYGFTAIYTAFDLTKMIFYLGLSSGIFNIIADIFLVKYIGIAGAAIASFLVFSIVPIIWLFYINKYFGVTRKLALLFPLITVIIMLINITNIYFMIKLFTSLFLIITVFLISRRFNLFNKKDSGMINNISLPDPIKNLFVRFINFASRK